MAYSRSGAPPNVSFTPSPLVDVPGDPPPVPRVTRPWNRSPCCCCCFWRTTFMDGGMGGVHPVLGLAVADGCATAGGGCATACGGHMSPPDVSATECGAGGAGAE